MRAPDQLPKGGGIPLRHIVSKPRLVLIISCPCSLKPKPSGRVTASVEIDPPTETGSPGTN